MEIKLILIVSFEMESKTDLRNRKKVVLAPETPPIFFSVSEALACTIQVFFRTAILREYWASVVDSHTNTVISHPDACIVFIIFLVIHCCKHHNCCWGLVQVLMFRRRGGRVRASVRHLNTSLRSPLASATRTLRNFRATFAIWSNF